MKIVHALAICLWIYSANTIAMDMPPLAKKHDCTACHAIDSKVLGPAWMDVSRMYKDQKTFNYDGRDYPLVEGLITKVSLGGSGHWGTMPMPANDPQKEHQDDVKWLVNFILDLSSGLTPATNP